MGKMETAMANLEDTSVRYLTREVDMFPGSEMVDRAEMLNDIREMGKLNAGAECLIDPNGGLGELENRIAISDEITNAKLLKEKDDMAKRKGG